jgi:hypothetical protein
MRRTYQVWLKDMAKCIEFQADDVDLDSVEHAVYWNFVVESGHEDAVTVAAFPCANVAYVVSV